MQRIRITLTLGRKGGRPELLLELSGRIANRTGWKRTDKPRAAPRARIRRCEYNRIFSAPSDGKSAPGRFISGRGEKSGPDGFLTSLERSSRRQSGCAAMMATPRRRFPSPGKNRRPKARAAGRKGALSNRPNGAARRCAPRDWPRMARRDGAKGAPRTSSEFARGAKFGRISSPRPRANEGVRAERLTHCQSRSTKPGWSAAGRLASASDPPSNMRRRTPGASADRGFTVTRGSAAAPSTS